RYARPARVYEQLGGEATFNMPQLDQRGQEPGLAVRVFEEIGEKIPINPEDASLMRRDLSAAGYRSERALPIYIACRVLAVTAPVILALIFRGQIDFIASNGVLSIVFVVAAGFIGYFAPTLWLDHAVSSRNEILRMSLPDALDLMVVSVEAGLGLDQAIQ